MRAVNLLPPNAYTPKQRLPHAPVVLAATAPVLAGALVYLGYSFEHSKVTSRASQLGLVQSEITILAPSPELVAQTSSIAAERSARRAALADVLAKRMPWDLTFGRLARVIPKGAWLINVSANSPTPATSSTSTPSSSANGFTAQGYADSQETVAIVLERFALIPGLSNIVLENTVTTSVGTTSLVQFSISAQVGGS